MSEYDYPEITPDEAIDAVRKVRRRAADVDRAVAHYTDDQRWDHPTHKPDAHRQGPRWRVDCSCGWRGPLVSLPGHGYLPWERHFSASKEATQ